MNRTIKIGSITWNELPEDASSLNCPICGEIWIRDGEQYDPSIVKPCKHLKFRLVNNYGVEWFGRWKHDNFVKAYGKSYVKICDDPDLHSDEVTFNVIDEYTTDALKNMEAKNIDEVLVLEESGLACGLVSMTIMYGIKHYTLISHLGITE